MMNIRIVRINDEAMKSLHTKEILRSLPEWFGNEKALCEYVKNVAKLPYWIALNQNESSVGFISVKIHYGNTGDIYVFGVLPEYHNQGIGKKLLASAAEYFRQNGCKYVIVKTLSEKARYEPYERTRKFYTRAGFEPLITLTEMWAEENPCLIMIKKFD
ncbi:MAG TPA: GNAT family N-acetyltransferase [Methylomusa anaerophila]|uniref:Mycothiol acetyltransferase n=1 Tax=Methylomusa anaerophila TaxID=1930071 RepID=A0A348AIS4_9FIRM|nr:GNAT family N-acetyltransferase [Methylomusa anaerophila]BBB90972.1 mycothiol acetyltransferase [Methylomusa anaerophila]HML90400.1 GNAT family N-acetyltransferase [Methylomusa anaerophila]